MEYIKIAENMEFSRIIQGFWRLPEWKMTDVELRAFLDGCLERGVNTFDTAEIYGFGQSEELLGRVLSEMKREEYKLVTKTGIIPKFQDGQVFGYYDTRYDTIIQACKSSLIRLNCEYIDLYLIHREDPMINPEEVAEAFKELKKQGLVREFGVSNFDPHKFSGLNKYMDGQLRTNQIEWNPCCFEHFETGMVDLLMTEKIHPMIWSPLCGGEFFTSQEEKFVNARTKFTDMARKKEIPVSTLIYAWLMYHPIQAMPLVGSGKLERLDDAIAALDVKLEHVEWYELYVASGQKVLR